MNATIATELMRQLFIPDATCRYVFPCGSFGQVFCMHDGSACPADMIFDSSRDRWLHSWLQCAMWEGYATEQEFLQFSASRLDFL